MHIMIEDMVGWRDLSDSHTIMYSHFSWIEFALSNVQVGQTAFDVAKEGPAKDLLKKALAATAAAAAATEVEY